MKLINTKFSKSLSKKAFFTFLILMCYGLFLLVKTASVSAGSCSVKISKPNACDSLKYRPENFCKGRKFVPDAYNYNKPIPCDKNMHIDHVISVLGA